MMNTSLLISKIAPFLEEQNIFIKKITFETFEDNNKFKINIECKKELSND